MGKTEGMGQILSCCALMKSNKSLQQLCTGVADSRAETKSQALGLEKREDFVTNVTLWQKKGSRALKTLCVHTCVWKREKEGGNFWLLVFFNWVFFMLFLCNTFSINVYTVCLMYAHENAVLPKVFCFSEVFYGWLLHHNFGIFITLWLVSCIMLYVTLPFLVYFLSLFFLSAKQNWPYCRQL